MLIAFFVEQQQLDCKHFTKALAPIHFQIKSWERQRSYFFHHFIDSKERLWNALACGTKEPISFQTQHKQISDFPILKLNNLQQPS